MEPLFLVNGIFPAYYAGTPGFSADQIAEPLAYILDASGWKLYKRNGVSTAVVNVESVSGLPRLEPTVKFTAAKISLELLRRVVAWFQVIYLRYKSEAVGYLYYQPTSGEWDFVPPAQTVSAASAKYDRAPRREGWQVAGTIHSHASMSAFHSGVDDADEASFDGVHITIGRLDSVPEYSCSLVVQGQRVKFELADLVNGLIPQNVPVEWIAAVKLPSPTGLLEPFNAQATALYERYYSGELGEEAYKAKLAEIEEVADAVRPPIEERLGGWSPCEPEAVSELVRTGFAGDNDKGKGGRHGRRPRG